MKNCRIRGLILLIPILLFNCKKDEFEISASTNKMYHVKNGDYLIPLLVRGNTASGKIILFVQGGPGNNTMDFAEVDYPGWKETLEKDYALAYYEQRGCGNSQGNFNKDEMSVNTYLSDIDKVIKFLKFAYKSEVILMGHSFGGHLVYRYMLHYGPAGGASKYISVNGMVTHDKDPLRWEFRRDFLYNTAQLEITEGNNVQRWNDVLNWLVQHLVISSDEEKTQWNNFIEELVYEYYPEKSLKLRDYLNVVLFSSYNPIPAYLSGKSKEDIVGDLLDDVSQFDLNSKLSGINQPLLLITGRYDDVCPPEELNYIYNQVSSPTKKIEIIEKAGHECFNHQQYQFQNLITNFVK